MSFLLDLLEFVLFCLSVLALFSLYRMLKRVKPKLYFNPSGECASILEKMPILRKVYRPTWWLFERNIHTIWGMRNRPRSPMTETVRRELLVFSDGGTSALDWFEESTTPKNAPIVIIIHTLAGGTREPCSNNLATAFVKRGWRAVVANNRSCGGAPITSERLYDALSYDDIQATVKRVREEFEPRHLFLVGFSLGAYQALQYCCNDGGVDAVACVSHTYDGVRAARILERPIQYRLYNPVIVQKLVHMIKKSPYVNCPEAEKARTMAEFDDLFACPRLGLKDHVEYYSKCSIYDKIDRMRVKALFLGATDDPFTSSKFMPIEEIRRSQKCALVTVSEGGHVSFLTGSEGKVSYVDLLIPEWFKAIADELDNQ